ncbi:thermonuclease family protein [Aquamicrobium sp.]|uniref:thermonuclease family protein n=1 Tax=Aquamicrobium sp. TaxID=1872579 RepID=UPI00349E8AF8
MKRRRRSRKQRVSRNRNSFQAVLGALIVLAAVVFGFYLGDEPTVPLSTHTLERSVTPTTYSSSRVGRATVIDGDTIEISGERVRFNGIDAPESNQMCRDRNGTEYRCGARSAEFLDNLLASSRPTRCDFVERDQYGRFVGDCYLADGQSVNVTLVREGHAVDWPRYSGGAYTSDQADAQRASRGIWQGQFDMPWDFRAGRVAMQDQIVPLLSAQPQRNCDIKGNISSKGERIYHSPGQMHYDRTRISTSQGERWFCSEEEARAAGWRKARR